ncbi:unnamed protein product [Linum trigynum]|uniref:Uncharacterized protein n=1 Tax=Linum trigynum TaxID=586398 RepID=A0AAV2EXN3_9ROSI
MALNQHNSLNHPLLTIREENGLPIRYNWAYPSTSSVVTSTPNVPICCISQGIKRIYLFSGVGPCSSAGLSVATLRPKHSNINGHQPPLGSFELPIIASLSIGSSVIRATSFNMIVIICPSRR